MRRLSIQAEERSSRQADPSATRRSAKGLPHDRRSFGCSFAAAVRQ